MQTATLRIVHVFPRFKTYSGAEHFCFQFAREAVRRHQRVTVVTRHLPTGLAAHLPDDVEVRQLSWAHRPTRFHFLESLCDVLYSPFLFRLVPEDSDYDIYWNDNTLSSLFIDSLRRKKNRVFLCMQLPHFAYGQTGLVARSYPPLSWLVPVLAPLYRWLDKLFAGRADLVIAISKMVRDDCVRVYRRDVAIASPGIDPPAPHLLDPGFIRRALPIRSQHILVSTGKIIPKKNFDLFVQVVHRLRQREVDVTGVIVGDGPLRERVARLIRSLELEPYCLMTGFVSEYADVLRYMSGATLYVYLERDVPFGLTPLEAGSLGVPVVAFEGGGVEETVVDGENGRKLPAAYGAEEIADLIAGLLEGSAEELARMGDRAKEMVKRWTWGRAYDRFLEYLGSLESRQP
jgi:glycosyltransferase involved in cell wall biosynthesis